MRSSPSVYPPRKAEGGGRGQEGDLDAPGWFADLGLPASTASGHDSYLSHPFYGTHDSRTDRHQACLLPFSPSLRFYLIGCFPEMFMWLPESGLVTLPNSLHNTCIHSHMVTSLYIFIYSCICLSIYILVFFIFYLTVSSVRAEVVSGRSQSILSF